MFLRSFWFCWDSDSELVWFFQLIQFAFILFFEVFIWILLCFRFVLVLFGFGLFCLALLWSCLDSDHFRGILLGMLSYVLHFV